MLKKNLMIGEPPSSYEFGGWSPDEKPSRAGVDLKSLPLYLLGVAKISENG
jgi:hypothetical protein